MRDTMAIPLIQPGVSHTVLEDRINMWLWLCVPIRLSHSKHTAMVSHLQISRSLEEIIRKLEDEKWHNLVSVMKAVKYSKLESSEIRDNMSRGLPWIWEPQGCQHAICRTGNSWKVQLWWESPTSSHGSLEAAGTWVEDQIAKFQTVHFKLNKTAPKRGKKNAFVQSDLSAEPSPLPFLTANSQPQRKIWRYIFNCVAEKLLF